MNNPHRLPWKRLAGVIFDCDMKQVGTVYQRDDKGDDILGDAKDEANAEFMVCAVNGYEAAIGSLRDVTRLLKLLNAPGTNDPIEVTMWKACAVLAARDAVNLPVVATEEQARTAREEWREAVAQDSTRLGFADWCIHQATHYDNALLESTLPQHVLRAIGEDAAL